MLNVSSIFFILFSKFWNFLTAITLNSFSGELPTLFSFIYSYMFLPHSFICSIYIFFCHFLYLFLMNGTVPILLVVWLKVSSSGACRLLGRVRSWHWDVEFRDTILWFMSPGPRYSLLVQQFRLSALLPQEHRPGLWPMNQDPIASGYCKKRTMKNRSILKE